MKQGLKTKLIRWLGGMTKPEWVDYNCATQPIFKTTYDVEKIACIGNLMNAQGEPYLIENLQYQIAKQMAEIGAIKFEKENSGDGYLCRIKATAYVCREQDGEVK